MLILSRIFFSSAKNMPHLLLNAEGTVVSRAEECLPQGSLQGGGEARCSTRKSVLRCIVQQGRKDRGGVGERGTDEKPHGENGAHA